MQKGSELKYSFTLSLLPILCFSGKKKGGVLHPPFLSDFILSN
jgi:hypothetical protein